MIIFIETDIPLCLWSVTLFFSPASRLGHFAISVHYSSPTSVILLPHSYTTFSITGGCNTLQLSYYHALSHTLPSLIWNKQLSSCVLLHIPYRNNFIFSQPTITATCSWMWATIKQRFSPSKVKSYDSHCYLSSKQRNLMISCSEGHWCTSGP